MEKLVKIQKILKIRDVSYTNFKDYHQKQKLELVKDRYRKSFPPDSKIFTENNKKLFKEKITK